LLKTIQQHQLESGELVGIDQGIRNAVEALISAGVETFESCEGGLGHAYPEPTIRFHGDRSEGFRAFAIAVRFQLGVTALRRIYCVIDDELVGPHWEICFAAK